MIFVVSWLFFFFEKSSCKLFRVSKPNCLLMEDKRKFSSLVTRERERRENERHGFSQRREGDKDDE